MNFGEAAQWQIMIRNHCGKKKNCRTSSSLSCCGNVYQGDIHHPNFLGDFTAMPFPSCATNPIFVLFIEKLKKFQQPALVGRCPCPWSFRSFPTQVILWLQKGLEFGILVGIHLWKGPACDKRSFWEIQQWPAAKRALICVENNAGALLFSLILVWLNVLSIFNAVFCCGGKNDNFLLICALYRYFSHFM